MHGTIGERAYEFVAERNFQFDVSLQPVNIGATKTSEVFLQRGIQSEP